MADLDILDTAVMLRDAQRSLRSLFTDYEEKIKPCRELLRRMMADIPTDKVLVALTHALQAVVDANGGEYGDTQRVQMQSLWLTAAAKDLLDEEHAVSVADKVKNLVDGLDLGKRKNNRRKA